MKLDTAPLMSPARDRLSFSERRSWPRQAREGSAMAAFYDEDGAMCLTRVELLDTSPGGLGLRCPVEIPAGTRFWLYSPAARLPHVTGRVVHCDPDVCDGMLREDGDSDGTSYRIGLRCEGGVGV